MRRKTNLFHRRRPSYLPQKKRAHPKIILGLFALLLFLLLGYFINARFLKLSQINCSLDNGACRQNHLDFLKSYEQKNFLLLKPAQIKSDLLRLDPALIEANVTIIFPGRLQADLISDPKIITLNLLSPQPLPEFESEPATSSSTSARPHPLITEFNALNFNKEKQVGLTSSGRIVSPEQESNLFVLQDPSSIPQSTLLAIFAYHQELTKSSLNYLRGLYLDNVLIVKFNNGLFVFFDLLDSPYLSVTTLQRIRAEATIGNDAIIDLRFDNPVISTYHVPTTNN